MNANLWRSMALMAALATAGAWAADHLDTPSMLADPAADIGDLYAWTAADGKRLNLVMTIVGRRFSDQVQYVFYVSSGPSFGRTPASTRLLCQFDADSTAHCWAGTQDRVHGDASKPAGLWSESRQLQVFAGLRDDPYFNNVRGTRAALDVAAAAVRSGTAPADASGFRRFDEATLKQVAERWRHTDGGPARNFLAGWQTSALVMSVDLEVVAGGGPMLSVWARTERRQPATPDGAPPTTGAPLDRMGRALTGNALLATVGERDIAEQLKEAYNRLDPAGWPGFAPEIARNLALYDSFDGVAGNQWRAGDASPLTPARYRPLADLLADDRLWVDTRHARCEHYLAVERSAAGEALADCGGRTPLHNVNGVFRSLLIRGTPDGVDDGVAHDDREASAKDFPFLVAP